MREAARLFFLLLLLWDVAIALHSSCFILAAFRVRLYDFLCKYHPRRKRRGHSCCQMKPHTHTLSPSLSHTHTHTHTLYLKHTHTHTLPLSLTHTLPLSLSLTHTHTH